MKLFLSNAVVASLQRNIYKGLLRAEDAVVDSLPLNWQEFSFDLSSAPIIRREVQCMTSGAARC